MDGSEHPLVLGASMDGSGPAVVHLTRNFVPGTVQNATNGMLYSFGGEDETFYLLPALEGEKVYFQGQLEEISGAAAGSSGGTAGGDTECVAMYDEETGQWKLEMVTYRLAARLQRGSAPGSHLLLGTGGGTPQAAAAAQPGTGRPAGAMEPLPSGAFGDELNAALFGDDEEGDGQAEDAAPAAAAPEAAAAAAAPPPQQHQQQHPVPQQQPAVAAAAAVEAAPTVEEEEDDALWDDALPSLPTAKAAPAPAAPAAAAEPPRRRGVVLEDRAEGDGGGGGECSEDDSDGCGMEAF